MVALRVFVNVGSGSHSGTLIGPRAFGQYNAGDYAIFNMDSGHMLVSTILQKRSFVDLKALASRLAHEDYTQKHGNNAQLMNWLFKRVAIQHVREALTSTEKFEYELEVRALRSALHLGPLRYHPHVTDTVERRQWAAYELDLPNFEIASIDGVMLPDHSCHAVIAISPFEYYPMNRSTLDLLEPRGYFVVAGAMKYNRFARNPAGETNPGGKDSIGFDPCKEFPVERVDVDKMKEGWFTALKENQRSIHTHSTDFVTLEFSLFRLRE